MRERFPQVLSIAGTVAVIGFHCDVRGFPAGWTAVEFFFALAGARMAGAIERGEKPLAYGFRRIRRLAPEFFCVYFAGLVALTIRPTPGLKWFALTAPVFAHNWTRLFFEAVSNVDWLFLPLWYVGVLIELQIVAMALGGQLRRWSAGALFAGVVVVGVGTRTLALAVTGGVHGEVSFQVGDAIYWTPFAHVECLVAGYLVGRGSWKALGAWMPAAMALLVVCGGINLARRHDLPVTGLGYSLGLTHNFGVLWGYPVLAIAAASFVAPSNRIARWVNALTLGTKTDAVLTLLAGCTYGVYVFHGAWLGGVKWLLTSKLGIADNSGIRLFVLTLFASLASAWLFQNVYARVANFRKDNVA